MSDYSSFLLSDPNVTDIIDRYMAMWTPYIAANPNRKLENYSGDVAGTVASHSRSPYAGLTELGLASYLKELASEGKLPAAQTNATMAFLQRQGQAAGDQAAASAAARGFGGSGLVPAIREAAFSGATQKQADVKNAAYEEEWKRKMQGLGMLPSMVLQPAINWGAIATGQFNASQNAQANQDAYKGGLYATLGGILGDILQD